jgi:hypothetical protein
MVMAATEATTDAVRAEAMVAAVAAAMVEAGTADR